MAGTGGYVITRYDADRMRSVPIPGKRFDTLDAALKEAVRLNALKRYRDKPPLLVDLAEAFTARSV